jgi:hypothetical protein
MPCSEAVRAQDGTYSSAVCSGFSPDSLFTEPSCSAPNLCAKLHIILLLNKKDFNKKNQFFTHLAYNFVFLLKACII